jgi:hypothetical protein
VNRPAVAGSALQELPYRGRFGDPRPGPLHRLALSPAPMPPRQGARPLKQWRYVGVYGPELMICAGTVRIGPARQAFWAIWDRGARLLHERTVLGRGGVRMRHGHVRVDDRNVAIDLRLSEDVGIETICPSGDAYAWTRKQAGIRAWGFVEIDGHRTAVDAAAVIDDTAAYYQRHVNWRWSAGVGVTTDDRAVAWNLVTGVNDPDTGSERTLWVDGDARELGPATFAPDLSSVATADGAALAFSSEATRAANENKLLIRSRYRQPFGTFTGSLRRGLELATGYGVMEEHDVYW